MVIALPAAISLKLDQTLAQWRHWNSSPPLTAQPDIIKQLGAGKSNCSVLVGSDRRFVVRIDGINPTTHGLNRQAEWHTLNIAHEHKLAPRPCYFNPELGTLVSEYLTPDQAQPAIIDEIAELLQRIHQLPSRHHRLDLRERIRRYEKWLQQHRQHDPELFELRLPIYKLLDRVEAAAQPMVLCHNDLLQANRIYHDSNLYALDWEYCAMGSAWYDIAVVAAGDELATAGLEQLLAAYCPEQKYADKLNLVLQYACIYRYIESLWYRIEEPTDLGSDFLEKKMSALQEKLAEHRL